MAAQGIYRNLITAYIVDAAGDMANALLRMALTFVGVYQFYLKVQLLTYSDYAYWIWASFMLVFALIGVAQWLRAIFAAMTIIKYANKWTVSRIEVVYFPTLDNYAEFDMNMVFYIF